MAKSTRSLHPNKPSKPHKDFPLFAHQNGQWAKKIRGKLHYFGLWEDPDAALHRWLDEKDELLAGRTPREKTGDGVTLKAMLDRFLTGKADRIDSGELSRRTLQDYTAVCQIVADEFGKDRLVSDIAPDDFSKLRRRFAKLHGPVRLGKDITVTRMAFKFAYESGLIETSMRFGPNFTKPSRITLAKHKQAQQAKNGKKMFEAGELRLILDAVSGKELTTMCDDQETDEREKVKLKNNPVIKAMVLLGINCGFGNHDCADLPESAVDPENGWIDFPRPKTAVERRCPLWAETAQALREVLASRPTAKHAGDADRVFLTTFGGRWVKTNKSGTPDNAITKEFNKLLSRLAIKRPGVSFYALRHTFETIAGEVRDQVAVDRIMGYADQSMAANYRHRISDERLQDVINVVHMWLWPPEYDTTYDTADIIKMNAAV